MLEDAGDFHKSAHLKVGGLRHTGEGDEGNRRGGACNPRPSVVADTPTAPRIPVTSGKAAHTTQASQLQWCPWPQKLDSSSKTCGLVPPATKTPKIQAPNCSTREPNKPVRAETQDPSYPLLFPIPQRVRACPPRDLGWGEGSHHPSDAGSNARDTLSNKAPKTPEAQAATTRAAGITSKGGGGGWKVPNLNYNWSRRNQSNAQNSPSQASTHVN